MTYPFVMVKVPDKFLDRSFAALVAFSLIVLQQLGGSGNRALAQATATDCFQSCGTGSVEPRPAPRPEPKPSGSQLALMKELNLISKIASQFPLEPSERKFMEPALSASLDRQWRAESDKLMDCYTKLNELPPRIDLYFFVPCRVLDRESGAYLNSSSDWQQSVADAITCAVAEPLGFAGSAGEAAGDLARLDRLCRHATQMAAKGKQEYLFQRALWAATTYLRHQGRSGDALAILAHCQSDLSHSKNASARALILSMSAKVYEASGRLDRALDCRKHAVSIASVRGCHSDGYIDALLLQAETCARLKKKDEFHNCWMKAYQLSSAGDGRCRPCSPSFLGGSISERLIALSNCAVDFDMIEESDRIVRAVSVLDPAIATTLKWRMKLEDWYEENYRYGDAESLLRYFGERARAQYGGNDADSYGQILLQLSSVYKRHADSKLGVTPELKARLLAKCEECFYQAERCVRGQYKPGTSLYTQALSDYVDNLPHDKAICIKERFLEPEIAQEDTGIPLGFPGSVCDNRVVAADAHRFPSIRNKKLYADPEVHFFTTTTVGKSAPVRMYGDRKTKKTSGRDSRSLTATGSGDLAAANSALAHRAQAADSNVIAVKSSAAESGARVSTSLGVTLAKEAVVAGNLPDSELREPRSKVFDIFQKGAAGIYVSDPFQEFCAIVPRS